MNGIDRITQAFADARSENRAALMPYFTLGFPNQATSYDVIVALAESGADLIELGVPFSDPLADGLTIQHSTQVALDGGASVPACLQSVRDLRAQGVRQPLLLMGYVNPVLAYGIERYVADAQKSGADGLIVPDLPLEEAEELEAACARAGMALVFLAAPNASDERLARLAAHTSGFLYLVSLTGVTGARDSLSAGLSEFVARARRYASTPVAVGFGIARPDQAAAVGKMADGVIIGSALIKAVEAADDAAQAARTFLTNIRAAL